MHYSLLESKAEFLIVYKMLSLLEYVSDLDIITAENTF
jgi:hypothetical protein